MASSEEPSVLESSVFPDHRTRVAAERRARMHRKLVESALLVFAEKGVDAPVIDDVIAAAGVSRGTFYNYFRTNGELLAAAIQQLGNELVEHIEERVKAIPSPAVRVFTGLRLYMDCSATVSAVCEVRRADRPASDRARQPRPGLHPRSPRRRDQGGRVRRCADSGRAGHDRWSWPGRRCAHRPGPRG